MPVRRQEVNRRRALAGIGAAGAGLVGALVTGEPASAATVTPTPGLPVLRPGDGDWTAALTRTPQVQLVPGQTCVLDHPVQLPDGCLIVGNGATVTVTGTFTALLIDRRHDVTLANIRFLGQSASALNSAPAFDHVAIRMDRSTDVRVLHCDFTNWRGAGVASTGSVSDDYFAYRNKVFGNAFYACYFGLSTADRSEYSIAQGNSFAYCRLAIWNSSGNWAIDDNDVVGCHGAYYSIAATSPYGQLSRDNWGHGSLVGNTFNHANSGAPHPWTAHTAFPLGGQSLDPGPGVVVEGLLPPTFTGNTLWYTDITAASLVGTPWLISGCTLSNLTVTAAQGASIRLVGVQANGAQNLPRLVGDVKDVLADLY